MESPGTGNSAREQKNISKSYIVKWNQYNGQIDAQIVRDPAGVCRIMVKRAKYKHWFELGQHHETDSAFEQALEQDRIHWAPHVVDRSKLF